MKTNATNPPKQLSWGSGSHRVVATLDRELQARKIHGGDSPIAMFRDRTLGVFDKASSPSKVLGPGVEPGPVYRLEPGGSIAVPTGRIHIRAAEGTDLRSLQEAFTKLGFRIADIPGWAPHTAWLEATSGSISTALANLGQLRDVAGLEHIEPEVLTSRADRENK